MQARDWGSYQNEVLLQLCTRTLLKAESRYGFQIRPSTQFQFDVHLDPEGRLNHFDVYFHRLGFRDRLLLLLHDRFGFDFGMIGSALNTSPSSLKVARRLALARLEQWIWEPR